MGKKPDEEDSLLLGDHKTQRMVDYSTKPVRNVAQVVCAHCLALGAKHDKNCKKNN